MARAVALAVAPLARRGNFSLGFTAADRDTANIPAIIGKRLADAYWPRTTTVLLVSFAILAVIITAAGLVASTATA
jgi:hypothetical protein